VCWPVLKDCLVSVWLVNVQSSVAAVQLNIKEQSCHENGAAVHFHSCPGDALRYQLLVSQPLEDRSLCENRAGVC